MPMAEARMFKTMESNKSNRIKRPSSIGCKETKSKSDLAAKTDMELMAKHKQATKIEESV